MTLPASWSHIECVRGCVRGCIQTNVRSRDGFHADRGSGV